MADGRMLKKKISLSRRLAALKTDSARMLYTWLIPHLDIEGRFSADPDVVKGQVVPRLKHLTPIKIEELLKDLASQELIVRYADDGDLFLELRHFGQEQNLRKDREKESTIPSPTKDNILNELELVPGVLPENSGLTPAQVKLREVKLREDNKAELPEDSRSKKSSFGEFVTLTEDEHQKLISKFGKEKTEQMIDILDNAKGAKGYKYKSDYRAILSWVVDKVQEKETTQDQGTTMACKECGDSGRYAGIDESGVCTKCRLKP